ncbi:hypothetical protein F2Q70_00039173 [Brassica cretica]|uniref:AP2/ERF domain-containing protein n=2 Tax=Brassica TaxID=3705 RepID=A0A8S9KA41_BRACR|nr:hypothetical protein F2Q70_00039173 [Brassica cretica]
MVSLRRRRLLGLCCGPNGYVTPLPFLTAEEMITGIPNPNGVEAYSPGPKEEVIEKRRRVTLLSVWFLTMKLVMSEMSNKELANYFTFLFYLPFTDQPLKRRKRHRRKQVKNQEPCLMRGVYYKNMKWQAAIKVEKRQIHLGTFSSQEEAARLYDRAAFMCGREPNFELSEEDKRDLKQQSWEGFLACTRRKITNKSMLLLLKQP